MRSTFIQTDKLLCHFHNIYSSSSNPVVAKWVGVGQWLTTTACTNNPEDKTLKMISQEYILKIRKRKWKTNYILFSWIPGFQRELKDSRIYYPIYIIESVLKNLDSNLQCLFISFHSRCMYVSCQCESSSSIKMKYWSVNFGVGVWPSLPSNQIGHQKQILRMSAGVHLFHRIGSAIWNK